MKLRNLALCLILLLAAVSLPLLAQRLGLQRLGW